MIGTILMVSAFVFLVLATLGVPSHPRLSLGWAGMACWALSILLSAWR